MRYLGEILIIAKDGWPLETIRGRPITNFFRRLLLGHHIECGACWRNRQNGKEPCETVQNWASRDAKPESKV
jgi:hypothetical protein